MKAFARRDEANRGLLPGLLLAMTMVMLGGCGGGAVEVVPVRGQVTWNGGPPPAEGVLYFTPVESWGNLPTRPAAAAFSETGHYSVQAFAGREGLIPGRYRVVVECWKTPPSGDDRDPPPESHLPERYASAETSGIELELRPASGTQTFNIQLRGE